MSMSEGSAHQGILRHPRIGAALAFLAFAFATLLMLYPMLWQPYLPLVDIPNHIARFTVMADPEGPLSKYYDLQAAFLYPNSATDLLWLVTGMEGDPVAFARMTMMVYVVNFILSVVVLNRVATGRWAAWPAIAGLLVYNGNFIWGFQNYVFTIPFSLHALSLWLVLERRSTVWRALIFLPISILLYTMHLLAFGVLIVALLGREIHLIIGDEGGRTHKISDTFISGVPFLIPTLWYLYQTMSQPAGALGSRTELGHWWSGRLRALLSIQWENPLHEFPEIFLSALLTLFVLGLCFLAIFRTSGPRLHIVSSMKGPVIALALLSLIAPSWLNGVALIHIRFPFVAMTLLIAGTYCMGLRLHHKAVLTLVLTGLLFLKAAQFEKLWATHNQDINDLKVVLSELPPNSRLLPLRASDQENMQRRLWHAQAYAMIYQDAFIPTFFQGSHAVILKGEWDQYATAALRPKSIEQLLNADAIDPSLPYAYLRDWETKFTHILFLDKMSPPAPLSETVLELGSKGRFTLLGIRSPA
ncbi:hypothetical protein [Cognatishimia maritima]|uniref:Glycosyltransferase RgtA/B/C/D-like domain-containing protein n=1 Tax=Cognatishimia maritima TaxID=870908 RepID=A0A1M5WDC9_9RHOB|nr:hypothetical protein [Cognatishimia maritima]SHH85559.1 hypothetical protein SAMN04488044_0087 [Cognatishimia maritima]